MTSWLLVTGNTNPTRTNEFGHSPSCVKSAHSGRPDKGGSDAMWETSLCGLIRVRVWRSLAWQGLLARGIWERFHGRDFMANANSAKPGRLKKLVSEPSTSTR